LRGEPGERRAHIALDDGEDFLAVIRDPESLVVTLITEAENDG